ncbi:MAG: hypothetical protein WBN83_14405 [Desulfoprunum sp.]|jgi:hypothetical protein|uniref:hypothetical protein n=1 Tax=Desulfoprunum sp. TaxID=2020866 RepID=UPI000AB0F917
MDDMDELYLQGISSAIPVRGKPADPDHPLNIDCIEDPTARRVARRPNPLIAMTVKIR